jgi:hypothetical protein
MEDKKKGSSPFVAITIDTIDEWFHVLSEKVINDWNEAYDKNVESIGEVGREGAGYGRVADLMRRELITLQRAGYGLFLTNHLIEKTINTGGRKTTVIRSALTDSCYRHVVPLAFFTGQIVLRKSAGTRTKEVNGKKIQVNIPESERATERWMLLSANATEEEAKRRLAHMPEELYLDRECGWDSFSKAFEEAVAAGQKDDERIRKERESSVSEGE